MKRLLLFMLIVAGLSAKGQQFNNEWIDYSKTYYKFKVGSTGLYRISQATLTSLSLQNTPAENFQLWRNGVQVPLYTSKQTGVFGAGDYIEFWGEMNDGEPDNVMYRNSLYQLNRKWSLESDTASFFLTVNPSGGNARLVPQVNTIPGVPPAPEKFFLYTAGKYYKDRIGQGTAQVVGENVYSSAYDEGEGWASIDIPSNSVLANTFSSLHVYTGSGAPATASFSINAAGYNGLNARYFKVTLNGDSILGPQMDFFQSVRASTSVPLSLISTGTAAVEVTNKCSSPDYDRMIVAQMELTYPHDFNFNNETNFKFTLPASGTGNYLEITNFNNAASTPVLYDLTNGMRYDANIASGPIFRFMLQPSGTARTLLLVSEAAANVMPVTNFTQRNFVNYATAANQGNYLVITRQDFMTGGSGSPVNDFASYRNSAAGGSYNTKVYMIDQLIDQFGFGIRQHPLSIRNFVRWARANFSQPIKDVMLVGKGVNYMQYQSYQTDPDMDKLDIIPTFGQPASDLLLMADPGPDERPRVPIGRLSVINADEFGIWLQKLKEYEQAQAFHSPRIADKAWMKNVAHVVGAEGSLNDDITRILQGLEHIAVDTFMGAHVETFTKTSTEAVEQSTNVRLQNLFNEGIGMITYFGHSSSTTLEYNLDNPQNYNNPGKYPLFVLLGCNAGNFFNYNVARLSTKETIAEKYVLAQERGSIASIASTHLGIVHFLEIMSNHAYNTYAIDEYGKSIGEQMLHTIDRMYNDLGQDNFYARFHCEQNTLQGDPAMKLNSFDKPDYVIEDQLVKVNPEFISVAENSFRVDAKFMNLGKAVSDSITIEVKRTYPNNTTEVIKRQRIPGIRYIDSLSFDVPVVATRDKGANSITITVDADNDVDELYETNVNNIVTKNFFIYEDEARPVYPYDYSIINQQGIKFQASTANPFSPVKDYRMEIDTSALFASPLASRTVTSAGGAFSFDPGITFQDSTVYYWRVAPVPGSGPFNWNTSSFIYLAGSSEGFNQSHYYQHQESEKERINLVEQGREWVYDSLYHFIFAKNGIFLTATVQEGDIIVSPDGDPYIRSACVGYSLIFNVFDPKRFKPTVNLAGQYGSAPACDVSRQWNFEYSYMTPQSRKLAMDFMDSIPEGSIVVVRNILNNTQVDNFVDTWKDDTLAFGHNNSLYHKLHDLGLNVVDSFTTPRAFIMIYKKGDPNFGVAQVVSDGLYDLVTLTKDLKTPDTLGAVKSPLFGRAKSWKTLKWRGGTGSDVNPVDETKFDVIGVTPAGTETPLMTDLDADQQDVDISSIDAVTYPYLRLKLRTLDTLNFTPYQLRYWRVLADMVPEGAIAPNPPTGYFQTKDTVDIGEPYNFFIGFRNLSSIPFDSMLVKMEVTNQNNVTTPYVFKRRKLLASPDSLIVGTIIPTAQLAGHNTLKIEVNPDDNQPEQYHYNNFAFRDFYVRPDSLNPLLDVTFDGVHILNRDIVSSKPDIIIKLKDEAKWMILDDTGLVKVQVRYPNGDLRDFYFTNNNDTLQFTPAGQAPTTDNTAMIDFNPYFSQDGDYELIVSGKDRSDNQAGKVQYRVGFQVINKPMISNMLNYPNPFTTSTAFVFTITGSEVPQNIRIQILTITGKVVREITKDELGPLHIGRNITDFKWDGTDQYGQKLANGVYLYRVITNLNGKSLDKYKSADDNTDKYFNKGYGKMYLMR